MVEKVFIYSILLITFAIVLFKIKKFFQQTKSGHIDCSSCKGCSGGCDAYQK